MWASAAGTVFQSRVSNTQAKTLGALVLVIPHLKYEVVFLGGRQVDYIVLSPQLSSNLLSFRYLTACRNEGPRKRVLRYIE